MEVLFFILIIVFLSVNSKNNKKKKAQNNPAVKTAPDRAVKARPVGAKAQATVPKNVKPVKVEGQSSPVFMAAPQRISPQNVSILDEEGCVGGSMRHTHEEGESREEHRSHMEATQRREAEASLSAQAAMELAEMNLQRLRRAVVMAEILDRPKALRR